MEAGGRTNVVPDAGRARFEVRAFEQATLDQAIERVKEIVTQRTVEDTSAELSISLEHHPMHRSAGTERLVSTARELAKQLGFTILDAATGGASDANTAAAAGRPVLDGLGPVGGAAHSPAEYITISSIVPRTTLLAGLIASVGDDARSI
jgi:glutamate carboxypeptidase